MDNKDIKRIMQAAIILMDNKDIKRIMQACLILMEECYNNDSDNIQVEFEYENCIIKCSFDFQYTINGGE